MSDEQSRSSKTIIILAQFGAAGIIGVFIAAFILINPVFFIGSLSVSIVFFSPIIAIAYAILCAFGWVINRISDACGDGYETNQEQPVIVRDARDQHYEYIQSVRTKESNDNLQKFMNGDFSE